MFDDLHDPAPPSAGTETLAAVATRAQRLRRRRSVITGAGAAGVCALVVGSIVTIGGPSDRIVPAGESSTPAVSESAPTSGPSPDETDPSMTTTAPTVPTTEGAAGDPCRDVPAPPPWLVDGSSPGEATIATAPDGSMSARWGVEGSAKAVSQSAPDPSAGWFAIVEGTDQLLTAGRARAAVVPIGDGAIGQIRIAVSDESCDREYVVGPGVELEDAIAFAQDWVDALAAWDSLTLSASSGEICLSVDDAGPPDCVPEDFAGQYYSRRLDGTSLWVVLHVSREGEESWVGSSVSRSMSFAGDPALEVRVDIVRSCGATESPDSTVQPWGFGCSSVTPIGPSSDPAAVRSDVVAIDGNGDAVVFDGSAEPSVIFDGTDPDDPLPPEGPVTFVDGVVGVPGSSEVVVGVCCEPSAGALWRHDATRGEGAFLTYGHLPALTSYGNLVWYAFGLVNIGGLDGSIATTLLELDPSEWTVTDLAVVQRGSEPEEVLLLASRSDGTYLWRVFVGGGDMQLSQKISDGVATRREMSLAGWRNDAFYVLDGANDRTLAFRAEDLRPTVSDVRTSDGEVVRWRSAWLTPTFPRHVEENGELWVIDSSWGGEYVWVR